MLNTIRQQKAFLKCEITFPVLSSWSLDIQAETLDETLFGLG